MSKVHDLAPGIRYSGSGICQVPLGAPGPITTFLPPLSACRGFDIVLLQAPHRCPARGNKSAKLCMFYQPLPRCSTRLFEKLLSVVLMLLSIASQKVMQLADRSFSIVNGGCFCVGIPCCPHSGAVASTSDSVDGTIGSGVSSSYNCLLEYR